MRPELGNRLLLDPPGGEYPFLDYSELNDSERLEYVTSLARVRLDRRTDELTHLASKPSIAYFLLPEEFRASEAAYSRKYVDQYIEDIVTRAITAANAAAEDIMNALNENGGRTSFKEEETLGIPVPDPRRWLKATKDEQKAVESLKAMHGERAGRPASITHYVPKYTCGMMHGGSFRASMPGDMVSDIVIDEPVLRVKEISSQGVAKSWRYLTRVVGLS